MLAEQTGSNLGARLRREALAAIGLLALLATIAIGAASASAEPPVPVYEGLMDFPVIHDASAPEEYSWRVELGDGQELQWIDEQHAEVYYTADHHPAFDITAEAARDASGANVPTSLAVSGDDIVVLTVQHRAGDLAAGGAPFDYPITPGPSFEVGYSSVTVTGPPDEQEAREAREAREREARERVQVSAPAIKASMAVERSGRDRKGGSVVLAIRVSGAGALTVGGRSIAARRLIEGKPASPLAATPVDSETVHVRIAAAGWKKQLQERSGQVSAQAAITFAPANGEAVIHRLVQLTLRKKL